MGTRDLSGTTEISGEGIKKHFKNTEPWQPIFELVWNGLDAGARNVDVVVQETDMGGIESVLVADDGHGIDPNTLKDTFGRFFESSKNEDVDQHGAHGRGRLAFHTICNRAVWFTKSAKGEARILVHAQEIKKYGATDLDPQDQHGRLSGAAAGTVVELDQFTGSLPTISVLHERFSVEFGWYLALHPGTAVTLNAVSVTVPSHEVVEEMLDVGGFCFKAQIIRWDDKPSSEKSYTYLLDSAGKTVHKALSTFNNKVGFYTSIYVTSKWADQFGVEQDLLSPDAHTPNAPEWKKVLKWLAAATQRVYENFLRKQASAEVERYEADGLFPTYADLTPEYRQWRLANAKELVKSIYVADPTIFNGSGKKQKKVIIRLLDKLAVSNENDALFEVLNGVLDMDDESLALLAKQLKRTTLENIVATIEVLQRRQDAVTKIRALMNDHYMTVSETPDLQKIIEANTWLFGSRYETIGAEEDTFTKIAKQLRNTVRNINLIETSDLDEVDQPQVEGAMRQTDLFLARKIPTLDSAGKTMYRCVVIEIKRPSVSLNVKHLRQLDDYAGILMRHPEFSSAHMHFELILLGRKISAADVEIDSRLRNQLGRGEMGLVSDDPRMKRYVLNWYTLLDGFELTYSSMLEKLKVKRLELEGMPKATLVEELHAQVA